MVGLLALRFSRPQIFPCLVQMSFRCSDRLWWMTTQCFGREARKIAYKPFFIACSKVLRAGENRVACEYATSSAAFGYPMDEKALTSWVIAAGMVAGTGILNFHNPGGVPVPCITMCSLWRTVTVVVVKFTSHPASHSVPIEINDWD